MDQSSTPRPWFGPRPQSDHAACIYDVCIIGSGAGGSVVADLLIEAGKSVLVLEQGPYLPPSASYDELIMDAEMALGKTESGTWSLNGYPWSTCNVGGGTVFYGGASFRFREQDFHAQAFMPEANININWPYEYETLRPHYESIEQRIGIAASPQNDPTNPSGATEHFLPPVAHSLDGATLHAAATNMGLSPFPTPLAILTKSINSLRSKCQNDSPCIGHICPVGAKGDSRTVYLNPLQHRADFTLFAGLLAIRLQRNKKNQVQSVEVLDLLTRKTWQFRAKNFVVAANAIQSAALLLRSADSFEPSGMGNNSDLLGRGLCFKLNSHVVGYKMGQHSGGCVRQGDGPFSTVTIMDHYFDKNCPSGMGGLIYEGGYGHRCPVPVNDSVLRLEVLLADQPSLENRITLASQKDNNGMPRIVMNYNTHPRDNCRLEYMLSKADSIIRSAGCKHTWQEREAFHLGSCHLHGTCRASQKPEDGVVDPNGKLHDIDNVYIADGAYQPFPSGCNPTLTIQAVAHLVGSHLAATI